MTMPFIAMAIVLLLGALDRMTWTYRDSWNEEFYH
jgi:hypothetical protein